MLIYLLARNRSLDIANGRKDKVKTCVYAKTLEIISKVQVQGQSLAIFMRLMKYHNRRKVSRQTPSPRF
ncbi:hypothetical protein NG99_21740 [Erwinia typographi]|uniref:Uncharacterized protein n=1 Tax=Erwinia typographi TaxID=371042 RepID=A0A0A3YP13_9GAMM|nr:hypothetical protein NG99_21740 [Erwinia typographi]